MNLFKKKKYKISFRKTSHPVLTPWEYTEVTDGYILKILSEIQDEYDFDILSVKMGICDNDITIKCDKNIVNKVIMEFSQRLSKDIERLKW